MKNKMKALVWKSVNKISLEEREIPKIIEPRDAIVKVKAASICTSDLHIINGKVPDAVEGIILGHEFAGEVVSTGSAVNNIQPGARISVNCETFCGECRFCKQGFINNCVNGGWKLGCSIDGCHTEYVRVPYADTGLTELPDNVSYEDALFAGDILSTGFWSVQLCEIKPGDTIAVIGAGPVGLCAMMCARLEGADKIIAIDINAARLELAQSKNLADYTVNPKNENAENAVKSLTDSYGADCVIEAAGGGNTFKLAYEIARPNAVVAIPAMYEKNQTLPLPEMYGKNLTFKTGGVDGIYCGEIIKLISEKKFNTDFLISKQFSLDEIVNAYDYFISDNSRCLKLLIQP